MADTRTQIIEAADQLFYQAGYGQSSFADIAGAMGISRGNFYHHFKTKDAILSAVIAHRLAMTTQMLADWAQADTPQARIHCFIQILIRNGTKIMASGCPVGTLTGELAKLDHPAQPDAVAIFGLFRDWLAGQFAQLGFGAQADDMALHLLARSQGVAVLANALRDPKFVAREVGAMEDWVQTQIGERQVQ